jgi:hypothetical protein
VEYIITSESVRLCFYHELLNCLHAGLQKCSQEEATPLQSLFVLNRQVNSQNKQTHASMSCYSNWVNAPMILFIALHAVRRKLHDLSRMHD